MKEDTYKQHIMHDFVYTEFLSREIQSPRKQLPGTGQKEKNGASRYSYGVAFDMMKISRNYTVWQLNNFGIILKALDHYEDKHYEMWFGSGHTHALGPYFQRTWHLNSM